MPALIQEGTISTPATAHVFDILSPFFLTSQGLSPPPLPHGVQKIETSVQENVNLIKCAAQSSALDQ